MSPTKRKICIRSRQRLGKGRLGNSPGCRRGAARGTAQPRRGSVIRSLISRSIFRSVHLISPPSYHCGRSPVAAECIPRRLVPHHTFNELLQQRKNYCTEVYQHQSQSSKTPTPSQSFNPQLLSKLAAYQAQNDPKSSTTLPKSKLRHHTDSKTNPHASSCNTQTHSRL